MCIRDSSEGGTGAAPLEFEDHVGMPLTHGLMTLHNALVGTCLLYTSDAADDLLCVDLGGRRIIKKKKTK